jgi:hypothetical protein
MKVLAREQLASCSRPVAQPRMHRQPRQAQRSTVYCLRIVFCRRYAACCCIGRDCYDYSRARAEAVSMLRVPNGARGGEARWSGVCALHTPRIATRPDLRVQPADSWWSNEMTSCAKLSYRADRSAEAGRQACGANTTSRAAGIRISWHTPFAIIKGYVDVVIARSSTLPTMPSVTARLSECATTRASQSAVHASSEHHVA